MYEWLGVENATMPLEYFNHVLVLTRDLEATRGVYVDVPGLEDVCRPPFPFDGHWVNRGDRAVAQAAEQRDCLDKRTHARDGCADSTADPIDRIAFDVPGLKAMITALEEPGIAAYHRNVAGPLPAPGLRPRPNGVGIELTSPAHDGAEVKRSG